MNSIDSMMNLPQHTASCTKCIAAPSSLVTSYPSPSLQHLLPTATVHQYIQVHYCLKNFVYV